MSNELNVTIPQFSSRFIRKIMRKVLKERIKDLVRLEFDVYNTTKVFDLFGGQDKYNSLPKDKRDLSDKIEKERLKPGKDKIKIIQWEKELQDLEDLEIDLRELARDKMKSRASLIRSIKLVETLEDIIKNPLKIYDEIK